MSLEGTAAKGEWQRKLKRVLKKKDQTLTKFSLESTVCCKKLHVFDVEL